MSFNEDFEQAIHTLERFSQESPEILVKYLQQLVDLIKKIPFYLNIIMLKTIYRLTEFDSKIFEFLHSYIKDSVIYGINNENIE